MFKKLLSAMLFVALGALIYISPARTETAQSGEAEPVVGIFMMSGLVGGYAREEISSK